MTIEDIDTAHLDFFTSGTETHNYINQQFYWMSAKNGYRHLVNAFKSRVAETPDQLRENLEKKFHLTSSYIMGGLTSSKPTSHFLFTIEHAIVMVIYRGSETNYSFTVSSSIKEYSKEILDLCITCCTETEDPDSNAVEIDYVSYNPDYGASHRQRKISITNWDEAIHNYPPSVVPALDSLMKMEKPDEAGGKLILWHGPPGTGKTSAIRTIAKEWQEWADIQYVIDSDVFFDLVPYMIDVILTEGKDNKWKVLIIEDADEFLRSDAKKRKGQAMSRLLNLADGIVGQGLDLLIIITTNEPVGNIHTAIRRPGRCLANLNFGTFNRSEAIEWLKEHNVESSASSLPSGDEFSLADLYDLVSKSKQVQIEKKETRYGQYL